MIRAHRRSLCVLPVLAAALLLGACARPGVGDGSPSPSADAASPSAAASQSTPPSTMASASAAPSEDLGPFSCAFPIEERRTPVHTRIVDVRVGEHDGYDRVVFEFDNGIPEFVLSQAEAPYTEDPSGQPMDVDGTSVLQLVLIGATRFDEEFEPTYDGDTEFMPGFAQLIHLVEAGDFEAVSSWYIGLGGDACVRMLTLDGPDRLVIDIEH
jgi:hypothetical protein